MVSRSSIGSKEKPRRFMGAALKGFGPGKTRIEAEKKS
jgi:hypothetical protein